MMGKKVLAAKSGRAACPNAAASGGIGAKNARGAKSLTQRHKGTEKMKSSGNPWIGDVPEGWEVSRVKNVAIIQHGQDPKTDGDIPVYGSGEGSFKTCGEYKYGPTVLIGRKGATLHIPHYIEGKYWNVDTAFGLVAKTGVLLPKYLYYFCEKYDFQKLNTTVTIPSLTKANLLQIGLEEYEAVRSNI
jgi:type I restriction enzyme S subunit